VWATEGHCTALHCTALHCTAIKAKPDLIRNIHIRPVPQQSQGAFVVPSHTTAVQRNQAQLWTSEGTSTRRQSLKRDLVANDVIIQMVRCSRTSSSLSPSTGKGLISACSTTASSGHKVSHGTVQLQAAKLQTMRNVENAERRDEKRAEQCWPGQGWSGAGFPHCSCYRGDWLWTGWRLQVL
jgi:hypothetical protein